MVTDLSLFLYGFDITAFNQYINFQKVSMGTVLTAVLNVGNYTGAQFLAEIKRAMEFADGVNTYTVTLDRTINGGKENRLTISTSGAFLSILFSSGVNAGTSPAGLMGFLDSDYTGATHYTGTNNAGTILVPDMPAYNFQPLDSIVENDGVRNITASGIKETLVFAQMQFFEGEWKWITDLFSNDQYSQWKAFLKYATRQLQFEFTQSIAEDPTTALQCTLETTAQDSNGLKYELKQMTGENMYRVYQTGLLRFRIVVT